jgi:hypothetical protein
VNRRMLRIALRAYPARRRRRDGEVLLDTSAELIDGGESTALREALGLLGGGIGARIEGGRAIAVTGPWQQCLARLAVPVAAIVLALWAVAYVTLAGMGRFYPVILAAAALAFAGAVARSRPMAVTGWLAVGTLVAYAIVYAELHQQTGSRFATGAFDLSVDMAAAFLPLTVLGFTTAWFVGGTPRVRDLLWIAPAVSLAALQIASDPGQETPWVHVALVLSLFVAPFAALAMWRGPTGSGSAALLAAAATPEAAWLMTALQPGTTAAAFATMLGSVAASVVGVALLACRAQRPRHATRSRD